MSKYEHEVRNAVGLRGTIGVSELAHLLDVSDQTVRRIVKPMVERGEVQKVHGAIVSTDERRSVPFLARMNLNKSAKIAIAEKVSQLISPGDTIAIDTGSTSAFVAQGLRRHHNLTIVTNSAYIASTLAMVPGNCVYMAGSQLRDYDGAAYDRAAFATVSSHHVDLAILSVSSINPERGFLVEQQCEADMSIAMRDISNRNIWAVDGSKFRPQCNGIALPSATSGDILVTDHQPSTEYDKDLSNLKIYRV